MSAAKPSRVAVIAVHGVADQEQCHSARAIAAMLLQLDGEGKCTDAPPATGHAPRCYAPFTERTIDVPLSPPVIGSTEAAAGPAPKGFFQEDSPAYTQAIVQQQAVDDEEDFGAPAAGSGRRGGAGYEFMRSLLSDYKRRLGIRSYVTTRLESSSAACDVHVYEMYWADLSKLGKDPLRFFAALYQLVLHLCELGRQGLNDARADFARDGRWNWLVNLQSIAVRLLTLPIPILNIILLLAVGGATLVRVISGSLADPNTLGDTRRVAFAAVVAAALLSVALTYRVVSTRLASHALAWWLTPLTALALGVIAGGFLVANARPDVVLIFEWWLIAWAIVHLVFGRYERYRRRALLTGHVSYAVALALFIWTMAVAAGDPQYSGRAVEYATLWTMQLLLLFLTAAWIGCIAFAILAFIAGAIAKRGREEPVRSRAAASVRTSRLSLAISFSAMLAIVTVLWSALFAWGMTSLNVFEEMWTAVFPPLRGMPWLLADSSVISCWLERRVSDPCGGTTMGVQEYFSTVLLMSTTSGLPFAVGFIALALLILAWMTLPSVRLEGLKPREAKNGPSYRAGIWLTRGLDSVGAVTMLWWTAMFAVLPVFALGDLLMRRNFHFWGPLEGFLEQMPHVTLPVLTAGGSLIAASAGIVVFGIAKLGGSGLDIVLDVDNYLRNRPVGETPRARIAERYVSLLRFIAREKDRDGRPYDAVVIVSHSLGTLITADLLRFLSYERRNGGGDDDLVSLGWGPRGSGRTIPTYLFTMGSPLRQLMNRFFPHQYGWVRPVPDGWRELDARELRFDARHPDVRELRVTRWVNAYRSGDYVGRALWVDEWYRRTTGRDDEGAYPEPIKVIEVSEGSREMCIGLGAHTHYWDNTAPDIAEQLDALIRPR